MQKLAAELNRLYLANGADLVTPNGRTRAIALVFNRLPDDGESGHWERLCNVANALQTELGLPAPAVSISGSNAFGLWLSLEAPVPVAQAKEFAELSGGNASGVAMPLPPYENQATGKWAAFIHPGLGASFAGDEGLDVQPPEAGQVALLEGLQSVTETQFAQALDQLRKSVRTSAEPVPESEPERAVRQDEGLLLKDATLEDIVKHLQSKNIEPTFRFLSPAHHR